MDVWIYSCMLGAIWAHAVDASRGDVVGSRCPRAIACTLRHARPHAACDRLPRRATKAQGMEGK